MKNDVAIIRSEEVLLENITNTDTGFRIYGTMGRFRAIKLKQANDSYFQTEDEKTIELTREELLNELTPFINASKLVLFNKGL